MAFARFPTSGRPFIIGHRGASGHATENSLAAFRIAGNPAHPARCDGVELDVHPTIDGEFVVHHDPVLRTGEAISSLPLSRVYASRLADGSALPSLSDALATLRGVEVFIEVKSLPEDTARDLLVQVRAHKDVACHIHAFDHRLVARLRSLDRDIPLGVLSRSYPIHPERQVREAGASTLWQEAHLIDNPLVRACHAGGIAVVAWTVNEAAEAARLLDLGVDGLCGDWPERLRGA